jgi:hypothetical protein
MRVRNIRGSVSNYLEAFVTQAVNNRVMTLTTKGVCLDTSEASDAWVGFRKSL